jgi:hypothetical protein
MKDAFTKYLSDTEFSFKSHLGEFRNLREFRDALKQHGDGLYQAYAQDVNHFAKWVEDVFGDVKLANDLRPVRQADEALALVDKRVQFMELWLEQNEKLEMLTNMFDSSITTDFTPASDRFTNHLLGEQKIGKSNAAKAAVKTPRAPKAVKAQKSAKTKKR